ncbi:uncharacterized protein LOC121987510 [Zingiber officinale]|uniref:Uncharacterized protein n=1 Tax=Zingiber officinale TaxID=94328 RepID=A0A8J5GD72_ZINOF|nr:uncharacterized protein LOC121987510 [Zingiber officinale]KAG6503596.1 hypothetical protein ZIOFF_035912 [Zingiber officinale]
MHFSAAPSSNSWQPVVTADSTEAYYWLNWRALLCAVWVLSSMIVASILVWKFEGSALCKDELWWPCVPEIHPVWLLAFRLVAFVALLGFLVINVLVDGGGIFYYYTQWTFMLVTIYFLIGTLMSAYGCKHLDKFSEDKVGVTTLNVEQGTYIASVNGQKKRQSNVLEEQLVKETAGYWGILFQIIFQTSAGAVMLTDCVFWFIIFPFLAIKDYNMNFVLVGMHSINVVFLLGETALNSLSFPWFRMAYFLLWTAVYVLFQWVIHACTNIWWPYPFLDLSSNYAPIWYLLVALMHVPCYAAFRLIVKMKHFLLSSWFL